MKPIKKEGFFVIDPKNKFIESLIASKIGWQYLDKAILENAPVSVMVIDRKMMIAAVNKYFLRFSGSKNPIGRCVDKVEFFKREKLNDAYKKLLETGKHFFRADCQTVNLEGKVVFLNIVAVPLRNPNGQIEGVISMAVDNTEAVEAKNNLKKMAEELEQKIRKRTLRLNRVNQKLTDVLNLKSKFVADSSHDLRTPLTIIRGNVEIATMESRRKKRRVPKLYKIIIEEVERIENLLNDMVLLTLNEEECNQFIREKVDLKPIIKSAIKSLQFLAKKRKIIFHNRNSSKEVIIMGDKPKLEKLFFNIIHNAIKYTGLKGRIDIWLEENGQEVSAIIKDNGLGISKKDLPHIFERFYRVDKIRSLKKDGSGLGLSIAKRIVDMHRGSISVSSKLGKGSAFTILLPKNSLVRFT